MSARKTSLSPKPKRAPKKLIEFPSLTKSKSRSLSNLGQPAADKRATPGFTRSRTDVAARADLEPIERVETLSRLTRSKSKKKSDASSPGGSSKALQKVRSFIMSDVLSLGRRTNASRGTFGKKNRRKAVAGEIADDEQAVIQELDPYDALDLEVEPKVSENGTNIIREPMTQEKKPKASKHRRTGRQPSMGSQSNVSRVTRNRLTNSRNSVVSNRSRRTTPRERCSIIVQKSLRQIQIGIDVRKQSLTVEENRTHSIVNKNASKRIHFGSDLRSRSRVGSVFSPDEFSNIFQFQNIAYDDFNCFNKTDEHLIEFLVSGLDFLNLSSVYNDDKNLVRDLLTHIKNRYRPESEVPFHNFSHGFSVAQVALCFIIRSSKLRDIFDKKTLLAFVIAAVGHDVDHPGNDNYYEAISKTANSELHKGGPILENHHTNTLLSEFKENDFKCNLFKYLDSDVQNELFNNIAEFILATDMTQHNEHVEFLSEIHSLEDITNISLEEQLLLLHCLIHACDLSGQCMSLELSEIWEGKINQEMTNQYHKHKDAGHEIPKNLEHLGNSEDFATRFKSQHSFMTHVLVPYWEKVVAIFPEMNDFLMNLQNNQANFKEKMEFAEI